MKFKLIVFDWDGTLMDSEARIVDSIRSAFADVGEPPPSRQVARNVIGLGLDEAMSVLWPEGGERQRSRVVERYRHHFFRANDQPSDLFPGALEVLDWLQARGYLLGVATGKSRRGLEAVLEDTGLKHRFHATRCADEAGSKPHPEMLRQLMAELGVRPGDTLMVGDTEYDMELAHNAGASALAVCYGVHEPERLLRHRPLDCLASLTEIPRWLEPGARI